MSKPGVIEVLKEVTKDGGVPKYVKDLAADKLARLIGAESQPFRQSVMEFQAELIKDALARTSTKSDAARALGFTHHQSLLSLLDTRHKPLREELGIKKRTRRKPLIKASESKHKSVRRKAGLK